MHLYKIKGQADRLIILDNSGNFFDSTNLAASILSIATAIDFSMLVMYDRAYISPHNRDHGLPGEHIYVYNGSGVARTAGGTRPDGFTLGVANATPGAGETGKIEQGTHLFAVAYETNSGYITKPGPVSPGGFSVFGAQGAKKAQITALPIGPAGTVARQILATKRVIGTYNGNNKDYELFFIPGGRIGDNTQTGASPPIYVNFYDSDLIKSADYLWDNLDTIPAALGLFNFNGKMITWGEDANDTFLRVSKSGEPEAIAETDGYAIVDPGDAGGGVKNCLSYRSSLYIHKSQRAYVTQDNGASASTWQVIQVDAGVGTEVFGASVVLDSKGNSEDSFIIADRGGLTPFNGTYGGRELTWSIRDIWQRINPAAFNTVQVLVDPPNTRLFVTVPLDTATTPNYVLFADYSEGLDWDRIKWCPWVFPISPKSILLDVNFSTKQSRFKIGNTGVYDLSPLAYDDFGNAIEAYGIFALMGEDDESAIKHYNAIRARVIGSGNLQVRVSNSDGTTVLNPPNLVMSTVPGRDLERIFNFQSERAWVRLRVSNIDEWFLLNYFKFFAKVMWHSRPSV